MPAPSRAVASVARGHCAQLCCREGRRYACCLVVAASFPAVATLTPRRRGPAEAGQGLRTGNGNGSGFVRQPPSPLIAGPGPAHQIRATGDGEGTPPTGLWNQPGLMARGSLQGIACVPAVWKSDRVTWMSQTAAVLLGSPGEEDGWECACLCIAT